MSTDILVDTCQCLCLSFQNFIISMNEFIGYMRILFKKFLRNEDVLQHRILHPFAKKRQIQIVRVVLLLTFEHTDWSGVQKSKLYDHWHP